MRYGPIVCPLDFSAQGKRTGYFDLDHSDDRHSFSRIRAPLGVIRGGAGPTALVCGGNHGDEYEGQIIARRLFEQLEPEDVAGRLILAPALNMPAVRNAARVSPLDGGNLNRSFPGSPVAGPTCAIAGFVSEHLMPLADLVIDIHSGGSSADFLDSAYLCRSGDPGLDSSAEALAKVMALPHVMVVPPRNTNGDLDGTAHEIGCEVLSCELGGEGKISLRALEAGYQGVLRVLAHRGVVTETAAKSLRMTTPGSTRFLDFGDGLGSVAAETAGLVEPIVSLGTRVQAGQTVALLRDPIRIDRPPQLLSAPVDGITAIRRRPALVEPGDYIFMIAPEMEAAKSC